MPWLVRFTPSGDNVDDLPTSDLLNRHAVLVSTMWDLGSTGVVEVGGELLVGFEHRPIAERAASLATTLAVEERLTTSVEPVDESWAHYDAVAVTVDTTDGPASFSIVPGRAFGHGGHATTRLCLDLMSRSAPMRGSRFLDFGTGSGVLTIAANHLGAAELAASDIDESAIESAAGNFEANGVSVDLVFGGVDALLGAKGPFTVIAANVLLAVHEPVASSLVELLTTSGTLVVSGFSDDQTDRVIDAYRQHRPTLAVTDSATSDRWRGLVLCDQPPCDQPPCDQPLGDQPLGDQPPSTATDRG